MRRCCRAWISSPGRANRRSPRRDHFCDCCRLRLVPPGGPFRLVRRTGHDHRGARYGEGQVVRRDLRPGKGSCSRILGIRSVRCKLSGIPADRNARSTSKLRGDLVFSGHCHCSGYGGPSGRDLFLPLSVFTLFAAVTMKHQNILLWGGLRGAVALALALGLPPEIPHREQIVTISFAVVAFSVFGQGLTMAPFLCAE